MSMHFAPQWVKPIKPTGSLITPTNEAPFHQLPSKAAAPGSPFPALGQPRSGSPTTIVTSNPPLSYSRVTHTPASPSMPGDGYFPYPSGDGHVEVAPSPYPFRYSRDQILAVWDEEKIKERPIELLQLAESGAVIVSQNVVKPVGLRELSELEKKLLSTSVHPPMSTRRPQTHNSNINNSNSINTATNIDTASPMRRQSQANLKEGATIQSPVTGRAPFGGFGRGEGGVFGGAKFSGALAEGGGGAGAAPGGGRQPGSLGGGFGGVAKRTTRREASTSEDPLRSSTASTWRSARNASGTFEGVLGFGNTAPSNNASSDQAPNGKLEDEGSWGAAAAQRKRRAQLDEGNKPDAVGSAPAEPPIAQAEAHREATPVQQQLHAPPSSQTPQPQELGAINWYYRDPNGQEQGPFTGNQMHEWYSHSYFKDDLPVRREHETSFHTLAELKVNTGNAVQPFLSVVRPRLPPNLPIPLSALQGGAAPGALPSPTLNDSFHRLNMQGMPPQQQPYLPNAAAPFSNQFQPQFNGAPAYGQQQGWNPAPGPHTPGRMNGAFGSIGGGQQAYPTYGGAIGSRGPDMFGPSAIAQPSTWGAPNPAAAWQHQVPVSGPAPIHAPMPQQVPQMPMEAPAPDSYFPVEQAMPVQPVQEYIEQQQQPPISPAHSQVPIAIEQYSEVEHQFTTDSELVDEPASEYVESEFTEQQSEFVPDEEEYEHEEEEDVVAEPEPEPVKTAPEPVKTAPSAWGNTGKAPSRKSSVTIPGAAPPVAAASKLPPAPASLPPKPVAVPMAAVAPEPASPTSPVTPSVERSTPKPAPWAAAQPSTATGPSLREIQEAEARHAEARKVARAEARASASPAPMGSVDDTPIGTLSWGLPQQSSKGSSSMVVPAQSSTPPAAAWGGSAEGPKKTLKQIQEEEERRKNKHDAQIRAAQVTAGTAQTKRGYADLAAHATPSPAQVAAAAAQGWTTVGAAGKAATATTTASPKPAAAPVVAKAVVQPKPAAAAVSAAPTVPKPIAKAANGSDDPNQPSVEFIHWTKKSLDGLTVNVDEFIQMLLTFPIDPPSSDRNQVLEIIADSVYSSSRTLDGRRFAQEFFTKRKADAQRNATRPVQKITSLADVLKTQPKAPAADVGFKVVKAKKNRRN